MSTEKLLIQLLNALAERLKDRLVLKGGMLLRLLESPRFTQDLDLAFVTKQSKKEVVKEVLAAIKAMPFLEITRHSLNSRGIFVDVREPESGTVAALEINVVPELHLPSEPLSTARVSAKYALAGRVVRVMAIAEAFSNKIAACLERGAGRDLYDLSLFEPMTPFDLGTLVERLSHLEIARAKPRKITTAEAALLLRKRLEELTEVRLKEEIYPIILKEHRPGLLLVIRASVSRIIQRLEALGPGA